jgi:hypothetical protein
MSVELAVDTRDAQVIDGIGCAKSNDEAKGAQGTRAINR